MIGKRLKDAMDEWDEKEVEWFIKEIHSSQEQIAVRPFYTRSDASMDRLSEKINILAELVDQKIDLLLKEIKDK